MVIIMYFTNISDTELSQYHEKVQNRFILPLTRVLTSNLFKIETIISDNIYKIYPLFYCANIISNNPNDKILENKCIICEKKADTFLTFKSDVKLIGDVQLGYQFTDKYGFKLYAYDTHSNLPVENVELIVVKDGVTYTGFTNEEGIFYAHTPTSTFATSVKLVYKGETIILRGA